MTTGLPLLNIKKFKSNNLVKIGFTSNIFEVYDTLISGFLASIIGFLFLSSGSVAINTIISFAIFSIVFLIQPFSGIFWGYIGNKHGTGLATKYSMLIKAIPSCLIGLLPAYASIGNLAIVLLIILKLIQGFGAGGQVPTNFCYIYEKSISTKHNSFFCGLAACGGWLGSLLASLVVFLLYTIFSNEQIYSWAWRLPFLLSIPMFFVIFQFRKNIEVGPKNISDQTSLNWLNLKFLSSCLKSFILLSFMHVCFYMLFLWMPTYLESFLHISHTSARVSNVVALVAATIIVAFSGYMGKFVYYKKTIISCIVLLILFVYPLFIILPQAKFFILLMIQLIFVFLYAPIEGNYVLAIGKAFEPQSRNMGYALSWNLSIALCGGTTPLICSYFIHLLNFNLFPVFYLMFFGLIAIPAICFL